jgi:hypothetical protein
LENAKGEGEREGEEQTSLRSGDVWLTVETMEASDKRELLSTYK